MTETLVFKTVNSTLALTAEEKKLFLDLLSAQDRGGFYMVYNAMTDTAESSLQSRISTFSGGVGGAALAANRLAQVEGGPNGWFGSTYPGMYVLSQLIAESAYTIDKIGFAAKLTDNAGLITDEEFFNTAKAAWESRGVHEYFPGNILELQGKVLPLVNAISAELGKLNFTDIATSIINGDYSSEIALYNAVKDAISKLVYGTANSVLASLVYDRFEKTDANMLAAGYKLVVGPNGHRIYIDANNHVGATLTDGYGDTPLNYFNWDYGDASLNYGLR